MLLIETVIFLRSVSIFAETSDEHLVELAAFLDEVDFKAGERIAEPGDPSDEIYFIVGGRVSVQLGGEELKVFEGGECLGEAGVVLGIPRQVTGICLEDTRVLRLEGRAFIDILVQNGEIAYGVIQVLCSHLMTLAGKIRADLGVTVTAAQP